MTDIESTARLDLENPAAVAYWAAYFRLPTAELLRAAKLLGCKLDVMRILLR